MTNSDFSYLIDGTEEEFRQHCVDKDLGYIKSFHNLLVQTFNEVKKVKDDLVAYMGAKPESERTEEEKRVLNGLYSKLLRVEQRVFILREIIKVRESTLS